MPPDVLDGCYVISLRPVGAHAAMRRAAIAYGARTLALSPWKLVMHNDAATATALREALAAECVVFTSPDAVRAARGLQVLRPRRGQTWCAVGAGTAQALGRAGIRAVASPARMDSEGLLALPQLAQVRGHAIGLVTAPGGRGVIAATLQRRGARVLRADVYERVPVALSARALEHLLTLNAPMWLALSSGEALERILFTLPPVARTKLLRARVVAASTRLAQHARERGFAGIVIAPSARPRELMLAAAQAMLALP